MLENDAVDWPDTSNVNGCVRFLVTISLPLASRIEKLRGPPIGMRVEGQIEDEFVARELDEDVASEGYRSKSIITASQ